MTDFNEFISDSNNVLKIFTEYLGLELTSNPHTKGEDEYNYFCDSGILGETGNCHEPDRGSDGKRQPTSASFNVRTRKWYCRGCDSGGDLKNLLQLKSTGTMEYNKADYAKGIADCCKYYGLSHSYASTKSADEGALDWYVNLCNEEFLKPQYKPLLEYEYKKHNSTPDKIRKMKTMFPTANVAKIIFEKNEDGTYKNEKYIKILEKAGIVNIKNELIKNTNCVTYPCISAKYKVNNLFHRCITGYGIQPNDECDFVSRQGVSGVFTPRMVNDESDDRMHPEIKKKVDMWRMEYIVKKHEYDDVPDNYDELDYENKMYSTGKYKHLANVSELEIHRGGTGQEGGLYGWHTTKKTEPYAIFVESATCQYEFVDKGFQSFALITVSMPEGALLELENNFVPQISYLCLDNDKVGQEAMTKVAKALLNRFPDMDVCFMPVPQINKIKTDPSDYFVHIEQDEELRMKISNEVKEENEIREDHKKWNDKKIEKEINDRIKNISRKYIEELMASSKSYLEILVDSLKSIRDLETMKELAYLYKKTGKKSNKDLIENGIKGKFNLKIAFVRSLLNDNVPKPTCVEEMDEEDVEKLNDAQLARIYSEGKKIHAESKGKFYIYDEEKEFWIEKDDDYMVTDLNDEFGGNLSNGVRESAVKCLRTTKGIYLPSDSMNPTNKIYFLNTSYDPNTDEEEEHSPDDLNTCYRPINLNRLAGSPVFDQFVLDITDGDELSSDNLVMFGGISMTKLKKGVPLVTLYGDGANGKTIYGDTLKHIIGQGNYSILDVNELLSRFGGYGIKGKFLNISGDSSYAAIDDSSKLKILYDEDCEFGVELKGKDPFVIKPFAKFLTLTNEKAKMKDISFGMRRRQLHINLPVNFIEEGREDKLLRDKLLKETEGIVIRFLDGYQRFVKNGYVMKKSDKVKEEMMEYYNEQNLVHLMYSEMIVASEDKNQTITTDALWDMFRLYTIKMNSSKNVKYTTFLSDFRYCLRNDAKLDKEIKNQVELRRRNKRDLELLNPSDNGLGKTEANILTGIMFNERAFDVMEIAYDDDYISRAEATIARRNPILSKMYSDKDGYLASAKKPFDFESIVKGVEKFKKEDIDLDLTDDGDDPF